MKRFTGILSTILAVIIIGSSCCTLAGATDADEVSYSNKYPMIFVHGYNGWGSNEDIDELIPYWGATCGNLMDYLSGEGYECYSASVGPISSAWDRACELYAQLTGTRVDYGAVHSAKYNHKRYGRTYDAPLFEGWGDQDTSGNIKKVHLIGHSFGGTTIRMLAYLMTYGCEEETEGTEDGSVSPLFTGGKENYIESVTCICTPHNSASTYQFTQDLGIFEPLQVISALYCATAGRSLFNGNAVDFHLEQFGLTNTPGKYDADPYLKSVINFLENSDDSCQHDLTPEGMADINSKIKISENIYYYSYAFNTAKKSELTGIYWPEIGTNPIIAAISCYMGHHKEFTDPETGQVYDDSWRENDSLCNTISETYPFTEAHRDYDGTNVKGVWNVMPVSKGDHGTAIGLLADKNVHQTFYINLAKMLTGIEK